MGFLGWWIIDCVVFAACAGLALRAAERWMRDQANLHCDALIQALLWYGDSSHWTRRTKVGRRWRNSPAADDKGARARSALGHWHGR